jgi:hypothetical protein
VFFHSAITVPFIVLQSVVHHNEEKYKGKPVCHIYVLIQAMHTISYNCAFSFAAFKEVIV